MDSHLIEVVARLVHVIDGVIVHKSIYNLITFLLIVDSLEFGFGRDHVLSRVPAGLKTHKHRHEVHRTGASKGRARARDHCPSRRPRPLYVQDAPHKRHQSCAAYS